MKKIRINFDDISIKGLESVSLSILINSFLGKLSDKDKEYINSLWPEDYARTFVVNVVVALA